MKPLAPIHAPVTRRMKPSPSPFLAMVALPVSVLMASATVAPGQTAGSLSPAAPPAAKATQAAQKPKAAAAAVAKTDSEKAPVNNPSRYIGENDLAAYVNSVAAVLSIRSRATDPFGQYQDPDARPVIRTPIAKTTRRVAPAQTFPFSDIINRIKVNTVMPAEKKFLIGTRTFNQGERMNLTFRMKNIPVDIVSVSAGEIGFRNAETGENATLKMHLLPAGMTPGTGGIEAPGMIREQKNAPIDLDSAISTLDDESNR
jgi:hypothetical protein